jgi:hypothetical protein
MSRLRRHLSPALLLACLALLVAVGGTSYAQVALPANSVGTKQLKNGAVVASKVKLRSLLARNFRPGQLPRGPQGAQGLQGAAGPPGPGGPAGAKGDSATRLFASVRNTGSGSDSRPVLGPSSGAIHVAPLGTSGGAYLLTFNQDVNNCAVLGSPGATGAEQIPSGGMVAAAAMTPRTVTVNTFDAGGSQSNLDFTVAVFC